jgi:glycerophosphoryl diester phosphodiesterase
VRLRGAAIAAAAALTCAVGAQAATAAPYVHAHRGGPIVNGEPRFGENTMPAFRDSARRGFVLELDVKLSADRVPVVFHDATLERASDCEGRIDAKTYAELRECRVDILGTEGNLVQLGPEDPRKARIPALARVLRLMRRTGALANIEIKNQPTDPDFDSGEGFAEAVVAAIAASGVPPSNVIVQSFWPANLDVAKRMLPGAELSLLTLAALNDGGASFAQANGYHWVSPQWPEDAGYVAQAHSLGRRIVPYTLDGGEQIEAATRMGVDAVISNDPRLARRSVKAAVGPAPPIPAPPGRGECRATRASTNLPAQVSLDPQPRAPRMFAMQYKQELSNVESYASFRTKIECLIREYVRPRLARGRPDIVAFNEDVGLMTIATGSRGQGARDLFADPGSAPGCESQGAPCGAAAGLVAINAAYGEQQNAYATRFPEMGGVERMFVGPTDTFARGWMQVFSDMARRYRVYIIGSNTQAPFRESRDPSEIDAFADPDLPRPHSVYVATEGNVYNEAFIWGPRSVRKEGPRPLRNVVAQNRKVPLTSLEEQLEISNGPSTGPDAVENLRPYKVPGTPARLSIATSLPAFVFGHEIGEPPPDVDPCSNTRLYYMRCMDELGANVVIQDEANPGRWGVTQPGGWQPLEWMSSSWRHVADRSVRFDYNVTPFMVGNLADLVFDGQSSIAQRGRALGRGCNYVGTRRFQPDPPENDPTKYRPYAGRKRQFLAIAPWVALGEDRDALREVAAKLAPGSGDPLENDYVETALIADLPFPVDRERRACAQPPRLQH